MAAWHLYMLRTKRGALYTGITTDVERRVAEHEGAGGRGAKCLRSRGPVEVVYRVEVGRRELALRAEGRIKKLPKRAKERIVASGPGAEALIRLLALE